ncbi:MAG TPA: diguanylate cyclase [Gemmatimonadales bacterium]|nr:diguanylate cyclase [Gemmatimonadales bacterium]
MSILLNQISPVQRFFRLDTVRSKILAFALVVTLIPSGLTAWISYTQNRRALEEKISQELLSASAQTSREMDVWLKERLYDLRVFASSYEVSENLSAKPAVKAARKAARPSTPTRLSDYLNSVRERFSDYEELVVLNPQGRMIASSASAPRPLKLPADWRHELSATNAVVGEAFWDQSLAKGILLVAVPVQRGDGTTIGALAARLNLRGAEEGLRAFAPGTTGRAYLVGAGRNLIVSSHANSPDLMRVTVKPSVMERLSKREGAVVAYESVDGLEVLGSLKTVPRVGWAVLAEIPSDAAYQQVRRFRDITLAIVAGLLLGVTAIAYHLALLIVRPLDRLTKGAAEVAEGDLAVDLPTATGEVGDLTYVFNHMVGRLRQSRQELDAVNETLRQQNEELERLSASDSLTGLSNRRILTQRLSDELLRAQRQNHLFSVLMLDVDHFKKYNDAHGHPAGDEVLKRLAKILRASTRAGDCSARYGGEEFAVLLSGKGAEAALQLAERIRARVAEEEFPAGKITVSAGIAEFPQHGHTADAVISSADEALYEAKRAGRNRVVCAAPKDKRANQKT